MKFLLLFIVTMATIQYSLGQKRTPKISYLISDIHNRLKDEKISLDKNTVIIDTLFRDEKGCIFSVIDSLRLKQWDQHLIFFSDNTKDIFYLGTLGDHGQIEATFQILLFPNKSKIIVVKEYFTHMGYSEQSYALYKKDKTSVVQLGNIINKTGLSNSGRCPDQEECYEYKTTIEEIQNTTIQFHKRGTYIPYGKPLQLINEVFYLKSDKNKWVLEDKNKPLY